MSNEYGTINIVIAILGFVGSMFGFIFTALFNRSVKRKEVQEEEIKKKINCIEEKLMDIERQIDILQGEHNILSCQKGNRK